MNYDFVTSDEFNELKGMLTQMLQSIHQIEKTVKPPLDWVDGAEVKKLIGISPRKLQDLRDKGILHFSTLDGTGSKYFYRMSEINALFQKNYNANHEKEKQAHEIENPITLKNFPMVYQKYMKITKSATENKLSNTSI